MNEIIINARKKAEELDKFLQYRLSEDDYKTVGRLLGETLSLSLEIVKNAICFDCQVVSYRKFK